MQTSSVVTVTDANFDREVLASRLPFLLDFSAAWCPPCRAIEPIVAAIADDHAGRLRVGSSDVDANVVTATRYGVRNLPTLLLFRDGKVIAQIVGAVPRARLERVIADALAR